MSGCFVGAKEEYDPLRAFSVLKPEMIIALLRSCEISATVSKPSPLIVPVNARSWDIRI